MSFTFSPLGAVYLAMLFVPNAVWALSRRERGSAPGKERPALVALERVGQATTTLASLVSPAAPAPGSARFACFGVSLLAMALYELGWLRYFQSDRSAASLHRSFGPIPLPLAVLPVLGFLLLGVYELNVPLLAAVLVLAVGHIGIHWRHRGAALPTHR